MTKYALLFSGLMGLLLLTNTSSQNNGIGSDQLEGDPIAQAIDRRAEALLADPKINALSIAIYKQGKLYTGHYGELDPGKGNTPDDNTIYEIASISKSFAGTLVAKAVLDSKIKLEDDVKQYLDGDYSNLEYDGSPIRIRHLVTHTAGFPRFLPTRINALFNNIDEQLPHRIYAIEKDYTKTAFLEDLKSIELNEEPGFSYGYSNADVELLAHILEQVYRLPYDRLLQETICKEAQMKDTRIHLNESQVARLANGYGALNNAVPHFANSLWGAGGGVKSSCHDMLNYMAYQLSDDNAIVKESHRMLYNNEEQAGYLWPIFSNEEDGIYYTIHGASFGSQNYLSIMPKYKLGIYIVTNQSGPETQGKLLHILNGLTADIKSTPLQRD